MFYWKWWSFVLKLVDVKRVWNGCRAVWAWLRTSKTSWQTAVKHTSNGLVTWYPGVPVSGLRDCGGGCVYVHRWKHPCSARRSWDCESLADGHEWWCWPDERNGAVLYVAASPHPAVGQLQTGDACPRFPWLWVSILVWSIRSLTLIACISFANINGIVVHALIYIRYH